MTYSASDFTDDMMDLLQQRGLIARKDERRIDRLAEQGHDTVEECAGAASEGIARLIAKHDALKQQAAAERKRATLQRKALRDLLRWCDGNVPYFGEQPATRKLVERAETAMEQKS